MRFKEFLFLIENNQYINKFAELIESHSTVIAEDRKIQVEIPPEFEEHATNIKKAAESINNKPWGDEKQFYGARWKLRLDNIRSGYSETIYSFSVLPITGRILQGDSYRGTKDVFLYKEHPKAQEEIDARKGYVYRGMSMEEWILSQRRGYIESMGSYNLDQEGLTFYGNAETATYYASGFAPVSFKPGRQKPGVVIEIPRSEVMDHTQNKKIPHSEFAHSGKLPINRVSRYWLIVPTKIKPGKVEVIHTYRGYSEGYRFDPSVSYQIIPK